MINDFLQAIQQVGQLDPYQNPALQFQAAHTTDSGQVTVKSQRLRHTCTCPVCQTRVADGSVQVEHVDGRKVEFSPMLYHYVEAQHDLIELNLATDCSSSLGGTAIHQSVLQELERLLPAIMADA